VDIRQFEREQPYYKRDGNAYTLSLFIVLYFLNLCTDILERKLKKIANRAKDIVHTHLKRIGLV